MANSEFLFPNRADLGTFDATVGAWTPGLPLTNLIDAQLAKVARSQDAQPYFTKYAEDLGADYLLRGIALIKHNLSLAGQVRVRGHLNKTFTRTGLAAFLDVTTVGDSATYTRKYTPSGIARSWNYDTNGVRSRLLENTRTNGWSYSEDLSNAAWTLVQATAPSTPTVVLPDGYTSTTTRITEDSTAATSHGFTRNTPALTDNTDSTLVIEAKAGERSEFRVAVFDKAGAVMGLCFYDVGTAVVGTNATGEGAIENIGNGWYRCILRGMNASTGVSTPVVEVRMSSGSETISYNGDGASGMWFGNLQFEADQPFESSYISTESFNLSFQGFLELPGASGDYASTPDSAAVSVTGDIDIMERVVIDDLTPAADQATLGKWTEAGDLRSYRSMQDTTGAPLMEGSTDGTAGNVWSDIADATLASVGIAAGDTVWLRRTTDVDDGGGNHVTKFYYSTEQLLDYTAVTWTQLGSTITTAGAVSIADTTALLETGATEGGTLDTFSGKILRSVIFNGYDGAGTLVYDADYSNIATHATTRKSITENANSAVVTVFSNSAATARTAEVLYFDYTAVPQEMTVYVKFTEKGTIGIANAGLLHIGSATAATDPRLVIDSTGTYYRVTHDNGTTTSTATLAVAPVIGDSVELRIVLAADGSVTIGQSITAAAETTATDATAATLGGAWADTRLYLNSTGTTNIGFNAIHSVKAIGDTSTLAEMQALRPEDASVLFFDEPYDSEWVKAYGTIYPASSTLWGEPVGGTSLSAENFAAGYREDFIQLFSQTEKFGNLLVDFSDSTNAAGYVEVGRAWLANRYQPSLNFVPGASLGWLDDLSTSQRADSGAEFFDQRPRRRMFDATFENVDIDEVMVQMFEMMRRWGISEQFFFVYDPDDTIHLHRRSFLATLREVSRLQIPFASWASQPIRIVEVL